MKQGSAIEAVTPPPCRACGAPVRRAQKQRRAQLHGDRLLGGVRWNWFCSQRCGSSRPMPEAVRLKLRATYAARVARRLAAEVRQLFADGPPAAAAVARYAWRCERRGYARGYAAAWTQRRRAA